MGYQQIVLSLNFEMVHLSHFMNGVHDVNRIKPFSKETEVINVPIT